MPSKEIANRTFDARPDRVDYRDRLYNPLLRSLPDQFPEQGMVAQYLKDYTQTHKLILDQGKEGACTGFGLAAVVNYLLYLKHLEQEAKTGKKSPKMHKVSPRMLYQMARVYDEWPGEDYEGSSCRGAMKGWHRHGVCSEKLWPYRRRFVPPQQGWQQDAAKRPLGAYYRITKDSIADLQAAIYEVGAIYASAMVHPGWFLDECAQLPVIRQQSGETGGHAFAITGYTSQGFIVQNSWGPKWGFQGFAILTYEDWVQHGTDAWVAVLGAPMELQASLRTRSSMSLRDLANGKAEWSWRSDCISAPFDYSKTAMEPMTESQGYELTLVLGNDGRPINRFLDVEDAAAAVKETAYTLPLEWLSSQQSPKIAIYAHGGLNDEEASLKRIRVMAPYFAANNIYPLFLTWRTGFAESIAGILEDAVARFFPSSDKDPSRGWISDIKGKLREARDRSVEVACEQLLVKPIWMQMKQNAAAAVNGRDAGLVMLAGHLAELKTALPKLEIHLVGHSAGSILHGHLLDRLGAKNLQVSSCSLFAPACTVGFALRHYQPAMESKQVLAKNRLFIDLLSDERELADSVGPYGKSLLYLVSRALEELHKMPLLGMQAAWTPDVAKPDLWNQRTLNEVAKWQQLATGLNPPRVHGKERARISDGQGLIRLAHGSFDNDVEVITTTLERIRGSKLKLPVESLRGF